MALAHNGIGNFVPHGYDDESHKLIMEEGENSGGLMIKNLTMSHSSSSLGSPSSATSNAFFYQSHEEGSSSINFRGGFENFFHGNGSLLSFEHNNLNYNYQWSHQINQNCNSDPRVVEDMNCFQTASNFNLEKESHGDWLYSEGIHMFADHAIQESSTPDSNLHKRPHVGESMQAAKKQCNSATKKPKPKPSPSKDPQSIAAKNRRERISERLKILQELVPNGSKVDLVTMLEKAISYVKFLQLQVKVLATDEFWPVQGGKAPDISQVKEAIDAILSSRKIEIQPQALSN